ncbi:cell division protein FtsX [Pedomonas sp. V897]|uniref:cell division protein FtsX n=1 Tax=Pedomonas sp. V897 TaxID=3446482 RepID=UPI003EE159C4
MSVRGIAMRVQSRHRFNFLPEGRESHGVLPWVIAVMVYLMVLAVAGGIGLVTATQGWSGGMARSWTVQILNAEPAERKAEMAAAARFLKGQPGIASAAALPESAARGLLKPWLGDSADSRDLPVPGLIEVTLAENARVDAARMEAQLKQHAPSASIDDHDEWLGQLTAFARGLQGLAYVVVGLMALATAAIVTFSTRAGLSSHHNTIEILHLMGAEDRQIAREFQWRYLAHGLKGSVVGAGLGIATVAAIGAMAQRLGTEGILGSLSFPAWGWVLLVVLPLLVALLTMATARWTVHRALAEFL